MYSLQNFEAHAANVSFSDYLCRSFRCYNTGGNTFCTINWSVFWFESYQLRQEHSLNTNNGYSFLVLPDENLFILIMQLMTILIFINHQINGTSKLFSHPHSGRFNNSTFIGWWWNFDVRVTWNKPVSLQSLLNSRKSPCT